MKVRLLRLFTVGIVIGLSGCATPQRTTTTVQTPPSAEEGPTESEEEGMDQAMTVTGILEPTVEAGGWILKSEQGTYLLLGIAEYRTKEWFRKGARLKVWGKESPDTVTTYMQGMPFSVSRMEPWED